MVAAVLDTQSATVHSRESIRTEAARGPEDGFRRLAALIERVCAQAGVAPRELLGIGVGCTGPLDVERGRVQNPYTLPTWDDAPLMDFLHARFGLPGALLNDAQSAALGEFWNGAGRGVENLIYITVGTGIGGGIILGGKLYRGIDGLSAEVGHQVIDLDGPPCYCGARGCLEALAAAPAIKRAARERATPDGRMLALAKGDPERLSPRLVYLAARQGDEAARAILHQTGHYLGVGIANLLNVLAPDVVVLGGGVMQGWDVIAPPMLETVHARGTMIPFDKIRIVPASLKLNAGVTGAVRGLLDHLAGKL